MANITRKGRDLAQELHRFLGYTHSIAEICSLIARHATTYRGIQEGYCNGHPAQGNPDLDVHYVNRLQEKYDAWLGKREAQIEKRIRQLVDNLPHTDHGPITVYFQGDPRGRVVVLVVPLEQDVKEIGL